MPLENLLGLPDVRALTGLTDDGIRYHDERLRPVRIGTRRVWDRMTVLEFVAERAATKARRAATRADR